MKPDETIADIIAEARDKYTVHECNQCAWRKCCSKGFGSEECGKFRESIWRKLGIEDGYFTHLRDRLDAAHEREIAEKESVIQAIESTRTSEVAKLSDEIAELKKQIGDCAKLREALKAAELGLFRWLSGSISRDEHRELVATIKTALAATGKEGGAK